MNTHWFFFKSQLITFWATISSHGIVINSIGIALTTDRAVQNRADNGERDRTYLGELQHGALDRGCRGHNNKMRERKPVGPRDSPVCLFYNLGEKVYEWGRAAASELAGYHHVSGGVTPFTAIVNKIVALPTEDGDRVGDHSCAGFKADGKHSPFKFS